MDLESAILIAFIVVVVGTYVSAFALLCRVLLRTGEVAVPVTRDFDQEFYDIVAHQEDFHASERYHQCYNSTVAKGESLDRESLKKNLEQWIVRHAEELANPSTASCAYDHEQAFSGWCQCHDCLIATFKEKVRYLRNALSKTDRVGT